MGCLLAELSSQFQLNSGRLMLIQGKMRTTEWVLMISNASKNKGGVLRTMHPDADSEPWRENSWV
jgi:hypothetical protein